MRLSRFAVLLAMAALLGAALSSRAPAQQATPAPAPTAPQEVAPQGSPPVIPSPQPAADDPKIHKLAVAQFLDWQAGTVNRAMYSDNINAELTDEALDHGSQGLARLGGLQQVLFRGISKTVGANIYVYRMTCEHGVVDMAFALGPDGKIQLIFFE